MGRRTYIFAIIALFAAYKWATSGSPPGQVVETKSGKVQGTISLSREGREFFEWLGLPYAAPPVGDLRFEAPKPPLPWTGVREASSYRSGCAHIDIMFFKGLHMGAEDCLFLNVFTPKDKFKKGGLPVLFYIPGGYFAGGNADIIRPEYLMDEDIVVVTVNYRNNVLGFLSTGDGVIRGNMGLKDQAYAIRWVRDNIAAFGGNPEEITVAGMSAGGVSSHYQMLSPLNKGLFKRGISQSGTAMVPWATQSDAKKHSKDFASNVGCPTNEVHEMVKCLKSTDLSVLLNALAPTAELLTRNRETMFFPVIEVIDDAEAFIAETPEQLYASGKVEPRPWITGVTIDDGLMVSRDAHRNKTDKHLLATDPSYMERIFMYLEPSQRDPAKVSKLRQLYFGSADHKTVDPDDEAQMKAATDLCSDRYFLNGNHKAVLAHAKTGARVYPYLYAQQGFSLTFLFDAMQDDHHPFIQAVLFAVKETWRYYVTQEPQKLHGVSHGDDARPCFKMPFMAIEPSDPDFQFSKNIVKAFAGFAQGKPPKFGDLDFPQSKNNEDVKYIWIHEEPKIVSYPYIERFNLWKSLGLI